jgi:hypothetical protein
VSMVGAWTGGLVGFALGMRHALEPDHLTAVCTLVGDRPGARRGVVLGACWGAGHLLALLAVGLLLGMLQARMPPRVAATLELTVAVMLVVLGIRAMTRARTVAPPQPARAERRRMVLRTLLVGVVHGLGGSGALTALVMAELPSVGGRVAYVALFGSGALVSMALLSGLAGLPLAHLGRRPRVASWLATTSGGVSIALGVVWAVRIMW